MSTHDGNPAGANVPSGQSGPGAGRPWRERVRDPIVWADATQLLKTLVAAVAAWVIATRVFHLEQSFLAPWSALLVVNTTVYRTLSQGVRQVAATVVGVLIASGAGQLLGLDLLSVAVAMALGLAVGSLAWLEGEETTVAAIALVVLATGFSSDDSMLLERLYDTGIGIVVGILTNLLVWPPLLRRGAISAMNAIDDAVGTLLVEIADGIAAGPTQEVAQGWVQRTRELDDDLDAAWALVRSARESARLNPRRPARDWRDPADWHALLTRLEQAVAESRSMARTLDLSIGAGRRWDDDFRDAFVRVLRRSGSAIEEADPEPLREAHAELDDLVRRLTAGELDPRLWPEYGGVLTNLRNVLDAMDEVARANPLGQPALPLRRPRRASGPPRGQRPG